MPDYRSIEAQLRDTFILRRRPVAVTFNRVDTDLGDDVLYVAIPGKDVAELAAEATTIASANVALAEYHRDRRRALSTE